MNHNFDNILLKRKRCRLSLSSSQIILFGFLGVILLGTFLLMLPISSGNSQTTSFIDALFTATSATCVTGLIVFDTATYWSLFGQIVIITLIQIGGMGIVTIAIAITYASGKKIGLFQKSTMLEAISGPSLGNIVKMTSFIIKGIFLIEFLGALIMFPVFYKDFGLIKGIWYSIFHSISAFCNAGFDLMGINSKFSSLTAYSANPTINIVIMLLIIIGGISFLTWDDVIRNKWHFARYRMQSKVILIVTTMLICLPTLFFYFYEFENAPTSERILLSFFQSVTPRTAGFNTANFAEMSEGGITILIMLMMIGGSPGSTAGGMKTTTIAVLFSTAVSVFRKRKNTNILGRSIPLESIKNAATIFFMYLALFLTGSLAISCIENLPMLACMFETSSAIATVGLTLGITPNLSIASQVILILLMYFGRVGGLTVFFAAFAAHNQNITKLPQENINVG